MTKAIFSISPSRSIFLTCFMLVLVVFSTTMRFVGVGNIQSLENNLFSLDNTVIDYSLVDKIVDKKISNSDKKAEKEPLVLKKAHSSDALLQGINSTELFQNSILTPSIEFSCPSFSFQKIDSVTYYFSSSFFFKTLFSCFISPNAP